MPEIDALNLFSFKLGVKAVVVCQLSAFSHSLRDVNPTQSTGKGDEKSRTLRKCSQEVLTHFAGRRRQLSISNHIYREMHDKTALGFLPPVRSFEVHFVRDSCRLLCGSGSSVEGRRVSDFDCTKS